MEPSLNSNTCIPTHEKELVSDRGRDDITCAPEICSVLISFDM